MSADKAFPRLTLDARRLYFYLIDRGMPGRSRGSSGRRWATDLCVPIGLPLPWNKLRSGVKRAALRGRTEVAGWNELAALTIAVRTCFRVPISGVADRFSFAMCVSRLEFGDAVFVPAGTGAAWMMQPEGEGGYWALARLDPETDFRRDSGAFGIARATGVVAEWDTRRQ